MGDCLSCLGFQFLRHRERDSCLIFRRCLVPAETQELADFLCPPTHCRASLSNHSPSQELCSVMPSGLPGQSQRCPWVAGRPQLLQSGGGERRKISGNGPGSLAVGGAVGARSPLPAEVATAATGATTSVSWAFL